MPWTSGGKTRTGTREHKRWRLAVLHRDLHQCQLRYPDRCTVTATEADHITALHLGGAPLDPDNGRAACTPCHAKRSSDQGQAARRAQGLTHRPPAPHPGLRNP